MSVCSSVQPLLPAGQKSARRPAPVRKDSCPMWPSPHSACSTPAAKNCCVPPPMAAAYGNSISPQTVTVGQTATFNGSASALNGYASSVTLSCTDGVTSPPSTCTPAPSTLTPAINTPFTVAADGAVGDYYFNIQGVGSDSNHVTHQVAAVLHVLSNSRDFTLSEPTPFPTVNAGSTATSGPISVTAPSGFTG